MKWGDVETGMQKLCVCVYYIHVYSEQVESEVDEMLLLLWPGPCKVKLS